MKFFLVISIIAFWWIPLNSPGNIGMAGFPLSTKAHELRIPKLDFSDGSSASITKRKMDHLGYQVRKHLIKKELK